MVIYGLAIAVFVVLGTSFAARDLAEARDRGAGGVAFTASLAANELSESLETTRSYLDGSIADLVRLIVELDCRFDLEDTDDVLSFETFHVVAPDGRITCSSDPAALEAGPVYRGARWLETASGGETVITPAFDDPLIGETSVAIAGPASTDPRAGAIVAVVATDSIAERVGASYGAGLDASFTIVDPETASVLGSTVPAAVSAEEPMIGRTVRWLDDQERIFASADIEPTGWRLYVGAHEAALLAPAWRSIGRTAALVLAGLVVALGATVIVYRKVARPLESLQEALDEANVASMPAYVRVRGPSEVQGVAERFNALIDKRFALEDRIQRIAFEDELTGLRSRVYLTDTLDAALNRPRNGAPPAVLLISLDRFGHARDTFGHAIADALLIEAAKRLRSTAAEDATLARFAESTFAVYLPEISSTERLVEQCSSILRVVSQPFEIGGGSIELGARVGIAGRGASTTGDGILNDALSALAEARRSGEPFRFFDTSLRDRTSADARIERDLSLAIEHDELVLRYQPIVDVRRRGIVGVEALVRWNHPERGLLQPEAFLPVAERTGQMARLDRHVAAVAIKQIAAWFEEGLTVPVSINVSPAGIWEVETRLAIEHAMAFHHVPAKLLTLELTEGALIEESRTVRESIDELRRLGVSLAIDDFGTGYSSLAYLRRFPIDQLKIDRSFVGELDTPDGLALTSAIVGIADALHLRVVAEGVETEAQALALERLNCRRTQGFLFGEPMEPAAIGRIVAARFTEHRDEIAMRDGNGTRSIDVSGVGERVLDS